MMLHVYELGVCVICVGILLAKKQKLLFMNYHIKCIQNNVILAGNIIYINQAHLLCKIFWGMIISDKQRVDSFTLWSQILTILYGPLTIVIYELDNYRFWQSHQETSF